jgi:hypothetical protein
MKPWPFCFHQPQSSNFSGEPTRAGLQRLSEADGRQVIKKCVNPMMKQRAQSEDRQETLFTDLHTSVDGRECAAKALDKWHWANQSLGRSPISYKIFWVFPNYFLLCEKREQKSRVFT